jgi:PTH1 family peptidyl-tRNA hydrolase
VVDLAARQLRAKVQPARDRYQWAVAEIDSGIVTLARPTTFVNRSGEAVRRLLADLDIELPQLLVVVDDFNLSLSSIRIRMAGSNGGHNGLASIEETLETAEFARIRLGTGPLTDNVDAAEFVLSKIEPPEQEKIEEMVAKAAEAVIFATGHRLELAMGKYNSNPAPPES